MMSDEELVALYDVIVPPKSSKKRAYEAPMAGPMGKIADKVAKVARIGGRNQLLSLRRDQHTAFARQLAMYLSRKVLHASYPVIGKFFGRDHSTVVHGCKLVERRMRAQPEFAEKIRSLAEELQPLAGPLWDKAA